MRILDKRDIGILVVDDDKQLADILMENLTKLGYRAFAA